jgi:hypothetical protein
VARERAEGERPAARLMDDRPPPACCRSSRLPRTELLPPVPMRL